ncbi:MAG: methyltransferase domain-containing protein [Azospirillum sp.]|nr:methyltransferase domain-containing protein [Azospirillum sp.]
MSNWSSGYVVDIAYTHGFYRELSPALQTLALVNKLIRAKPPDQPFTYCELACGQGVSTNLLAAANPQGKFYAIDFNPAHAAGARTLAAAAKNTNVQFFDDSFEEFLERRLPDFDCIGLHGTWSWISPENRAKITAFLRRKLKVGGVLYLSYNTLPGWAPVLPLRELMVRHAAGSREPIAKRIDGAIAFIDRLIAVNARFLTINPGVKDRFERMRGMSRNYLAHEFFNQDWNPLYFDQVAGELETAKLSWAASAHLLDHVNDINLTADQRKVLAEIGDPLQAETIRDFVTNQQFRRDLFVKGPLPLTSTEQAEAISEMRFALVVPGDAVPRSVTGLLGTAPLQAAIYDPVIAAMADGARSFAELLAVTAPKGVGHGPLWQALNILVGMGSATPCLAIEGEAARRRSTEAFNLAILNRARGSSDIQVLASPVTGSGLTVERIHQLFLLAAKQGRSDPALFAWEILGGQNQRLVKDGKTLMSAEENLAELAVRQARFAERTLPILVQLGIA